MDSQRTVFTLLVFGAITACDPGVLEEPSARFEGRVDDGRSIRVRVHDADRVEIEVGRGESFDGVVEEGSFIALSPTGAQIHGHVGAEVSGFVEVPGHEDVSLFSAEPEARDEHHKDEVAVATLAATSGSTCSCVWVLGTSHYHCTYSGVTKCYGRCP